MVSLYTSFFFVFTIMAVFNPYLQVMIRNLGYSHDMVGLLLAVFETAGIVGPLLIARHVDNRGSSKNTILFCTGMSALGVTLLMVSTSIWMTMFALTILAFFLRSLIPIIDSYANNRLHGDAQKYAVLRSGGTIGFVLFSLLLAVTHRPDLTSNSNIGFHVLGTFLLFMFPVLAWKKEPKRPKIPHDDSTQAEGKWYDLAFIVGLVIIGLNRMSMSSIASFFSLYLVEELGINAISLMNAIASGSEFGALILAGYLLQRKKVLPVQLLMISSGAMVVRLLIYAMVPTFGGVLVAQFLHSLCYGFFHPAAIFLVARRVRRSHRTLGMSMYVSLGIGLPTVLGSSLGGLIVEQFGYRALFMDYSLFALASVVVGLASYKLMTSKTLETI
ncbi:MFS transporter [Sphaerochaeta halotolerans]|uniref:MFS transporter n=1 Tax=Sphaerochaeta halotolerans TaxID=2293840 RepID=UPI0013700DCE|nr:MFS transporter [Sphaerochaeta halotolerans]MXI87631.1 MFS transporter [Sphaerochaeta halotolerans]